MLGAAAASMARGPAGARALPRVLGDAPVAVLLIDRTSQQVTFANGSAHDLTGDLALPVGTDAWGEAAGLTDLDGHPLVSTDGPFSLVAAGQPIAGRAVRSRSPEGPERLLWITGFPLGATEGGDLSLVVLLNVDHADDGAGTEVLLQSLRERAVIATDICFTISDPRRLGNPLIWVNPSFTRVTGYDYDESIGRNCSFLQGPATDPAAVMEIRAGIAAQRQTTVTLLNYRKDGTAFWNQLSISPVLDSRGDLVSYVGVQSDVTQRVLLEAEREAAYTAERAARRESEAAQDRLRLMAEATTRLSGTLDTAELLDRLAGLCVPRLADWVFIARLDAEEVMDAVAVHHTGAAAERLAEVRAAFLGRHLPESSPAWRAIRTGRPVVEHGLTAELMAGYSRGLGDLLDELGSRSLLSVPLPARGGTRGVMTLLRGTDDAFAPADVDLARDLGYRAGLAMDNARLYQQEASVAEALQRSLLPELPVIDGIGAAAHYTAASEAAAVGGDFYDLLELPGDTIGIVIGDVAGHDLNAAATMGQLRGLIRATCWDRDSPDPAEVLSRVDRLLHVLEVPGLATAVLLRAHRPAGPGDPWRVECSNAGHPPVLLRRPDGTVQPLTPVHDLLLGADAGAHRRTETILLPAGSHLVCFTDGLIEQPDGAGAERDTDAGTDRLVDLLTGLPAGLGIAEVTERVAGLVSSRLDDVACLVVQLG